ncbi:ShTK domain protein [Trichostrongylus colubriformis]|uniref:ShTK domain protein n=1 Tax=Trichostrongylus colubriformis TaxID=6319 RepID=A0AAN8IZB4_TRICO
MLFQVLLALLLLSALTTEGAGPREDVCKDRSRNCKNKLKWCTSDDSNRVYLMKVNCRKTCNFCDEPKIE